MTETNEKALLKVVEVLDKVALVYGLSREENGKLSIELNLDNVDVRGRDE